MSKVIYMKQTADLLSKEEFDILLPTGIIKLDANEVPYLLIEDKTKEENE